MDLTQSILALLILSTITEKVTNFIKVYFIKDGAPNKERKVQNLATAVGIVVAFSTQTNVFDMELVPVVQSEFLRTSRNYLDWAGIILTGFFLGFGSKFFHDLLQLVFETKNLKKKLKNAAAWDFTNIEQVDQYLRVDETESVRTFFDAYFKKFPAEVLHYEIDQKTYEVEVVTRTSDSGIPDKVAVRVTDGLVIPYKVIKVVKD